MPTHDAYQPPLYTQMIHWTELNVSDGNFADIYPLHGTQPSGG